MVITVQSQSALLWSAINLATNWMLGNMFKCLVCPGLHKNYYDGYCQVSIIRKDNFVFSMHEYTDNRIPSLIKRNTNKRLYCKGKETLSAWPRKLSNSEYNCGGKFFFLCTELNIIVPENLYYSSDICIYY